MRLLPASLLVLLLVLFAGLGLAVMWRTPTGAGAGGPAMPASLGGKPQGHVYTGFAEEPSDVNPLTSHEQVARRLVLSHTHDTLLDRDPVDGALRGCLAERWEVSADGTTCTFTLREGVRFSDGAPLTMADVLFGWELAEAGHLPLGSVAAAFGRVAAVDVLDDRRLRVHLRGTHFAGAAAVGTAWIVAQRRFFVDRVRRRLEPGEALPAVASRRFAELLDQVDRACGPGTGPYALHADPDGVDNWRPGEDLLLVRNEHSWRRAAEPGTWNFAGVRTLFRDHAAGRNAFLRGELDWFSDPQIDELLASRPELGERYRKLVYDYALLGAYRCVWNCRRVPFDDARVREALGMLFPREEVVAGCGGAAKPAAAHAKPGAPGYPDVSPLPFDPPAARRLLREAGYDPEAGRPLSVSLLALDGSEPLRRIVELFRDAAKRAGVDLDVRQRDYAAFVAEKGQLDWDGLLVLQYFDAWGDPYRFLHSEGLDNEGAWQHPEADRLAAAAQVERDPVRRAALWRDLHRLAHREQPAALIVHPMATVLLNAHVEDAKPGPVGLIPERAWLAPEFQRR